MTDHFLEDLAESLRFFSILNEDVENANKLMLENDTQFSRRMYLRSFFALIEGNAFRQRELALSVHKHKKNCFNEEEVIALEEKEIRIIDNGNVEVKKKIVQFFPLFKLSNKSYCKAFNKKLPDYANNGWNQLQKAVEIRNRITHPKSKEELVISDDDLEIINEAKCWYSDNVQFLL